MVKQFGQILPEPGFQPRAIRLPYSPGHSANQSKLMLSTLPPFSSQAHLTFHQPTLHPRTLHHLQPTAPHLPHPLPNIHTLHSEDLHGVHPLPTQSLPETSANRAVPCPALPSLSHTQSSLLLHLFTGTHIHHEPQRMPQEADLTFLLWTSRQAQAVMDKPPPCPAPTPGMMSWLVQRRHLEPRKLTD